MKCPNCPDTTLAISERQGVELDYCPQCRGVWLDRGKLDKLIDRAAASRAVSPQYLDDGYSAQQGSHHGKRLDDHGQRRAHERQGGHGRRRKSWFGDLFD
ncbi:zf-TFIIB domain-containing protein [Paraburkholderia sp. A2WS-5]|uniref:TFIIB-type zinc ribbon-containing protein n=1 Tax=unclassified Paraburkholderia TaxID=2615204 RepID=UPI003B7BA44A